MSLYGRFEQIVTWILTLFIAIIIAVALFRLVTIVLQLLVSGLLNPLSHLEFEVIFGTVMTLLIAMEFNHSILETMNCFSSYHSGEDGGADRYSGGSAQIRNCQYRDDISDDYPCFGLRANRTRSALLANGREG
jgi:Phosphate-starvation-inducible E family